MSTWTSCATPPAKDGIYDVERRFKQDGSQLEPPEQIRWDGQWRVVRGSEILEHDAWRDIA